MKNGNTFDNMGDLVIQRGRGVLAAIVEKARAGKVAFTKDELYSLKDEICARLAQNPSKSKKSKENCVVQPGEIIPMIDPNTVEPPVIVNKKEVMMWDGKPTGLVKDGETYTYNGKKVTRI